MTYRARKYLRTASLKVTDVLPESGTSVVTAPEVSSLIRKGTAVLSGTIQTRAAA